MAATGSKTLSAQLRSLGVRPGGTLVVHTAFSRTGPVDDGPAGLVAALVESLGVGGTLVMPSMTSDDEHPYNVETTSCIGMGIVADTFWRMPGVLRSDNPHAFAAFGPQAKAITAPHPLDPPHGLDSPVGRAWELDAQVLLLGIGHDANTTIHLAENMAGVRYRRMQQVMIDGDDGPVLFEYPEIDHCCEKFELVDGWLDERHLQQRGIVGHGDARLARSRDIVDVVTTQLRKNETVFLHPVGHDAQCDEARRSLR